MDVNSELELVSEALGGNEGAFMTLVSDCKDTVARVAYFIACNKDEADDIASEAFLKAWTGLRTKKNDIPFRIWVCRIAKNIAIDRYRKKKQKIIEDFSTETDISEEVMDVRLALIDLPPEQRLPITMMYFDDMTISDISKVLQIPPGTVKSRIHSAKAKMRKRLGDDGQTD